MDRVEGGEVIDRTRCSCFTWFPFRSAATAFFVNSVPLPDKDVIPVPSDALPLLDPLKIILKTLGISVEHLVEGLRKCVNELGPEVSESVKKLLVSTACGVACERAGLSFPQCPCCPLHSHRTPFSRGHMHFPLTDGSYKVCLLTNLKESAISTFLIGIFE